MAKEKLQVKAKVGEGGGGGGNGGLNNLTKAATEELIDNLARARSIMHTLDSQEIDLKLAISLAKAGVFHDADMMLSDYEEYFGDIMERDDIEFLLERSQRISKARIYHNESPFDIEDEIDDHFGITE